VTAGGAENAAGADIAVPLHSRRHRRLQVGQQLQHVVPAAGLLFNGMQSLATGAEGLELALAIAGIVTSGLLIAVFAKRVHGLRQHGTAHHTHGIDWMEIFAAGVLFAEAFERWHTRQRVPGPQLLTAVVTLGIGLSHGWLSARNERRRSIRLTPDHLFIGRNKFSSFTARWDEIAEISINEREATIRTHRGRRRHINLADLENAEDVRKVLHAAQRRLGPAPS
jgi:hypothetical protein